MEELKIVWLQPGELIPYAKNAKKHDSRQISNVANSIRRFGWKQPIVIDDNNVVVIGHCRLLAAKKLHQERVPCLYASGLTDEEIRELRIADNKTNESPWDLDLLTEDIEGLGFDGFDFEFETAFDGDDAEKKMVEDDFDQEPPKNPTSKIGDVYQLGRHRLMCGDSANQTHFKCLIGENDIDLLLTDPPYNVNIGSAGRPKPSKNDVAILNDHMTKDAFTGFLTKAFMNAESAMRPGASYYIFYAGLHHPEFAEAVGNVSSWKLYEQLIWVKSRFVLGRNSDYQWMHEPCLYGWKTGMPHYFTDFRAESTVIEDADVKLSTLKKGELIRMCEALLGQNRETTVLRADTDNLGELHPTVKPQALLGRLINNSSKREWNVLDPFGGSGSTMIACE